MLSVQSLRTVSRPLVSVLVCTLFVLSGCAAKTPEPLPVADMQAPPVERVAEKPAPVILTDTSYAKIISPFGPRKSGKRTRVHKGVDIKAPKGCAVLAWDDGDVVVAGKRRGYGLSVDIRHQDGTVTRYAHMSKLAVKRGDRVREGAQLGAIGRTGRATTNHLHFEVLKDGKAVNPVPFLTKGLAQVVSPDKLGAKTVTAQAGQNGKAYAH